MAARETSSVAHSVTMLIDRLRCGGYAEQQRAAEQIWTRYVSRLVGLARRQLSAKVRRRVDPEDVLQSMYASFCERHKKGECDLSNRDELWSLLARITLNKACGAAMRHTRQRRDVRAEHVEVDAPAAGASGGEASPLALERLASPEPDAAEVLAFNEEVEQRLATLPDETLRKVAEWKLAGFTDEQIAAPDKLDCTVRTVERKTARIRSLWAPPGDAPQGVAGSAAQRRCSRGK